MNIPKMNACKTTCWRKRDSPQTPGRTEEIMHTLCHVSLPRVKGGGDAKYIPNLTRHWQFSSHGKNIALFENSKLL